MEGWTSHKTLVERLRATLEAAAIDPDPTAVKAAIESFYGRPFGSAIHTLGFESIWPDDVNYLISGEGLILQIDGKEV